MKTTKLANPVKDLFGGFCLVLVLVKLKLEFVLAGLFPWQSSNNRFNYFFFFPWTHSCLWSKLWIKIVLLHHSNQNLHLGEGG